jgi:flagellar protein FlaG
MAVINQMNSTVPYTAGSASQTAEIDIDVARGQDAPAVEQVAEDISDEVSVAQGNSRTVNEEIRKKVENINKNMLSHSEAIFGIHDETNRVTIKIVDKDTKKVIKEIPPEKTLDMLAKIWEMAGILVDEKR